MEAQEVRINLFTRTPGRVHVMGICGVGAASVAWMLHLRGWKVSGCDKHVPPVMERFFGKQGIQILKDHDPAHLEGCEALVYSAAIHAEEPELQTARACGLDVLSRGECLAGWVSGLRSVAVCGTHGKTTASCFATRLLQLTGRNPLWCLGGYTPSLLTTAGPRDPRLAGMLSAGQIAVAEADESDGTLALEHPAILVITNIEADHLDHFHNAGEIEQCFAAAVANTREGVAVCADAPRALRVAAQFRKGAVLTYGFSQDAQLRAENVRESATGSHFTLSYKGEPVGEVEIAVPGKHNVQNALGALASGILLGGDIEVLVSALPKACAELPKRRFQWTTSPKAPVGVVVDYAHHPTELQAMLSIARLQAPTRLRMVFQPHRYSRTKQLMKEFVDALADVPEVVLLPVYAASETPDKGSESYELYAAMRSAHPEQRVLLAQTPEEVVRYFRATAKKGDLILVAGAGDVERIGHVLGAAQLPQTGQNAVWATLEKALPAELNLAPDEPLAGHTCYRVGGTVEAFVTPNDVPALVALQMVCNVHRIPVRVVGGGANSWFSDLGLAGVLCALHGDAFDFFSREGNTVTVGAGMAGNALLNALEREGLAGLSFMQGIPGSVGGWARMNAGAHGHAFWECVQDVRMVLRDGQVRHASPQNASPGYRFVKGIPEGAIIVAVTLTLTPADPERIRAERREALEKRVNLAGLRTCGSLFKNPAEFPAGAALDALGAKAWRIGGASIAPQHANILVAGEGCTASDLLALMWKMKDAIKTERAVELHTEVQGFEPTKD